MIRAIIVDDEESCIDRLAGLLAEHCSGTVQPVGSATSVEEAIAAARELKPDVVFLDVQLNNATGFDMLQELKPIRFEVIFTTAFEKYAVQAFKFSALDYLLKPIDADDLRQAVKRLQARLSEEEMAKKLDILFHNLKSMQNASKKIAIPTLNGLEFLDVNEIVRCQADENYTTIFLRDHSRRITVARTLKEFEELLTEYNFFRVHNSHLINLAHIKRYHKGKGGYVSMNDNSEIEVSTRRKEEFLKRIAQM